ncbi:MAG: extensin family protein [Rhizobiales bacterium]|nr:extensin family protein [Hyphomicrobiales bacterium]
MKFSAGKAGRKWPSGYRSRDQWAMVTLAVLLMASSAALAATKVPLPQPRPAAPPALDNKQDGSSSPSAGAETATPPSACRLALTDAVAIAPSIPAITGPGACGGDDLVRLEAVVLPDGDRVPVKPAATLRCTMASAVADWIRTDMAPLAEGLGSRISELDNFDSFECRSRNRVAGAKLSEHGRANALDVRAVKLANGQTIALTDRNVPRELRERALTSACARFTTVLGPGSDGYHEDHIHLDLAERHNGYRICHWEVYDPMSAVAPLPAERPAEAPPREVASQTETPQETLPDREAARPAASQPAPSPQADIIPTPRGRPASAPVADMTGMPSSKKPIARPVSASSPPRPAAKHTKRKRKRHNDLPPFLRQLFN